jgi:7-cyano-7-deazaguanine synthase
VLAHQLVADGRRVRAVYVDFGSFPTLPELNSVRRTANGLGLPLDIVDQTGLLKSFVGHVPMVELFCDELDVTGETPYMFMSFAVPLAIVSFFAQAVECSEIFVGAVGEQSAGRQDLAGFFASWPRTIAKLCAAGAPEFAVRTPLLDAPKAAVVTRGQQLGVPMAETWSCHRGGDVHDGVCSGCRGRKQAFADAGVDDPTEYAA